MFSVHINYSVTVIPYELLTGIYGIFLKSISFRGYQIVVILRICVIKNCSCFFSDVTIREIKYPQNMLKVGNRQTNAWEIAKLYNFIALEKTLNNHIYF